MQIGIVNHIVSLARGASTGRVSNSQRTAPDAEVPAIKSEIEGVGSTTAGNGTQAVATDHIRLTNPGQNVANAERAQSQPPLQDLSNRISDFETQLAIQQKLLVTEFARVDASLQSCHLLLQLVDETLAVLISGGSSARSSPILTSGL